MRLKLHLKYEGKDGGSITLGARKLDTVSVSTELKKHPAIVTLQKEGIPTLTGEWKKKGKQSITRFIHVKPSVPNVLAVSTFLATKHSIQVTHAEDPDEKLPMEEEDAKRYWKAFVESMVKDNDVVVARKHAWTVVRGG